MKDRSKRRAERARVKAKRLAKMPFMKGQSERRIGCCINTPHPCSELCCGNPRKHSKDKTLQEKRAELPEEP